MKPGKGPFFQRKRPNQEREAEFRANRLFMLISGLLVVVSVGAFLWLAGVLEWRGSDGDSDIDITLQCAGRVPNDVSSMTSVDFDDSSVLVNVWSEKEDLTQACTQTKIQTKRKPLAVVSAGSPDAPGDDLQIAATFSPEHDAKGGLLPSQEAQIRTVQRLRLDFSPGDLLHYIGLGELDASMQLRVHIARKGDFHTSPLHRLVRIYAPDGFYVGSSRPSASLNSSAWDIDLSHDDEPVELSLRSDRLARLDHIIDASIAAVLGVGVGGIMAAWLALRVTRTKRMDDGG